MKLMHLFIAVCILSVASFTVGEDLINEGARVRVKSSSAVRDDGSTISLNQDEWSTGKLLQKNPNVLTLEMKKDIQMKFPVNSLLQVQVSHGKSRKKGVLIGAAVGAAGGLIYGAIDTASCNSQGGWFCGLAYGVTVVTIPVGALIGYAAAPEKWADVPLNEVRDKTFTSSRSFQLAFQW